MAEARARLPEVLRAAALGPQLLYRRDTPVGAIVGARDLARLGPLPADGAGGSLEDAFKELRRIMAEERYELVIPERRGRPNPFLEALQDEPSR